MDEASSKTAKASLFTLPRELRDLISEYACEGATSNFKATAKDPPDRKNGKLYFNHSITVTASEPNIGVLQICRQIRAEVQPMYYRCTTFTFSNPDTCIAWIKRRMSRSLLHHLRHVRIEVPPQQQMHEILKQKMPEDDEGPSSGKALFTSIIQKQAERTRKITLVGLMQLECELPTGALQVAALDKQCKMVWTSTPMEIEPPFGPYQPVMN